MTQSNLVMVKNIDSVCAMMKCMYIYFHSSLLYELNSSILVITPNDVNLEADINSFTKVDVSTSVV